MNFMKDFIKEPDKKELTLFLMPLICSGVFQQVYGLVNTAVVSRYLSYQAVAVIGACSKYYNMQDFIFVGMTTGFGFYIYRCIGTKNHEMFSRSFWGAFFLNGILAFGGMVLPLASRLLMSLIDIPSELQADAQRYLFFLFIGSGFLGLKNLLYCTIQGMGNTRFPSVLSMAGVVTHTFLTVFLIAGLRLGVEASALSIVLNNAFLSVCMFLYLLFHDRVLFRRISFLKIPGEVWKELLKNGIVKSGMMIFIGIGSLVMQKAVNGLSTELIAADAYANTLNSVFLEPLSAYAVAAGIITGQNAGDHNLRNIQIYNRHLLRRDFLWCIFFMLLNLTAAPYMIRILAGDNASMAVIRAGSLWLRVVCLGYPPLCVLLICRNALQSLGQYKILLTMGGMESLTDMFMSVLVPRYGYLTICFAVILKWSIPGMTALVWYRSCLRKAVRNGEGGQGEERGKKSCV